MKKLHKNISKKKYNSLDKYLKSKNETDEIFERNLKNETVQNYEINLKNETV